jgi:hypothetical protein
MRKSAREERLITFSYPSLSMRTQSKKNRRVEKYERIGPENPTVGIASSWERVTFKLFRVGENKTVRA